MRPKLSFINSAVVSIDQHRLHHIGLKLIPGLILAFSIASVAFLIRSFTGFVVFSPLMLAIAFGILIRNSIGLPERYQAGIRFCLKRLLRIAIALLGLQLSFTQLQQVGFQGALIITIVPLLTFIFTYGIGCLFNVKHQLTCLIAMGTAICGASAIVATSAVLDDADEDTAYAVGIVTVFGTLSMLLYPVILPLLQLSPITFGIWCGASIHEVAQAIAAAFQVSSISGEFASITKLARVLWLAPMVFAVSIFLSSKPLSTVTGKRCAIVPWFIVVFIGLVVCNSFNLVPESFKGTIGVSNQFLLTVAMAAMGLETRLRAIATIGLKPLYLGAISWLFITGFSLSLVKLID